MLKRTSRCRRTLSLAVLAVSSLACRLVAKMWRRFSTALAEGPSQPAELASSLSPGSALRFRRPELEPFSWLLSAAPCFPVSAQKITIFHEPQQFYEELVRRCEGAQSRITLASLYLGTGGLERRLVGGIGGQLERRAGRLQVSVLLDYQRGSRGQVNSLSLLLPLLQRWGECCQVSLYHTPRLRGLSKALLPPRWNELIELQHMKVYLVDDTVILSGANLSHDYFTNRQDRYVMIEDKALADFYAGLVRVVQGFSLPVGQEGQAGQGRAPCPYRGSQEEFIQYARTKLEEYYTHCLHTQNTRGQQHMGSGDTWVLPLVQAGGLSLQQDSSCTHRLLCGAGPGARVRLATGYFNLTQEYAQAITQHSQAACSLLMAHPNANGFKGARGPAGGVPDAYSLLARKFYEYVLACKQEHRISLLEYERKGWTYHGKGLWYYPPGESLPCLTLVGSPNFGERSVHRDLETQIALVTSNTELQQRLHQECERLHQQASPAEPHIMGRSIPAWVHVTVRLFRNYF